jgi:capsid assembly protease
MTKRARESDGSRYPQVVRAVAEKPWAILPSKFSEIIELVALRAEGGRFTDDEIAERIGAAPSRRGGHMVSTVAVLPLYGTIVPKADLFTQMSGGTSVAGFQQMFREALADQQVSAIVIDIDSPGGMVDLVPELAAEIRGSRGKKPIVAVANTLAASAAYWIGSQADEFVVTPSGEVGSIGVFCAHTDISAMEEMLGLKTTLVQAGRFKTELFPTKPLSEEAQAALQARVNDSYGMFVSDVAKGRKVPVADVRGGFGEGRVLVASMALQERMVDRIDTLEATVQRLIRDGARASRAAISVDSPTTVGSGVVNVTITGNAAELGEAFESGVRSALPPGEPAEPADEENSQAASSGLSFADDVDAALRAVEHVATRAEALRALTGTKRDQLGALVERITELLAASADEGATSAVDDLEVEHALQVATGRLRGTT